MRAQTPVPVNPVYFYLFWEDDCPHCAKAKPYFENLAAAYPEIQLRTYEVYYDAENQKLFSLMAEKYGLEQLAVPNIFIGEKYLQGYSEGYNSSIEAVVVQCIQNDCGYPGLGVIDTTGLIPFTPSGANAAACSPAVSSGRRSYHLLTGPNNGGWSVIGNFACKSKSGWEKNIFCE